MKGEKLSHDVADRLREALKAQDATIKHGRYEVTAPSDVSIESLMRCCAILRCEPLELNTSFSGDYEGGYSEETPPGPPYAVMTLWVKRK